MLRGILSFMTSGFDTCMSMYICLGVLMVSSLVSSGLVFYLGRIGKMIVEVVV